MVAGTGRAARSAHRGGVFFYRTARISNADLAEYYPNVKMFKRLAVEIAYRTLTQTGTRWLTRRSCALLWVCWASSGLHSGSCSA